MKLISYCKCVYINIINKYNTNVKHISPLEGSNIKKNYICLQPEINDNN